MAVIKVHRSCPAAETTALITAVNKAATLANAAKTDLATIVAKLNLDATVTDTDYAAAATAAAAVADTILEDY